MPISIACPLCQAQVKLPDNAAGRKFRCPKCKGVIAVKPAAPKPVIRPEGAFAGGFTDAPIDPGESAPIEGPVPLSSAAKKATVADYNPFADGAEEEPEEEKPKNKRYFKPKDDYNPFTEPPAPEPTAGGPNPEELFDFGLEDSAPPSAASEFDFGSVTSPEDAKRRPR
jgi:hypothetical protein